MDCDGDEARVRQAGHGELHPAQLVAAFEAGPCTVAEACTTDILGAAMAGLNGLTTSEKLEKMGKNGDAVNATRPYFEEGRGTKPRAR